jgi:peroxiredoxin
VSADTPDQGRIMVSDLGITYPILSDESREYIRDYDVLHPDEGIARPSLFVVDRDGIVRWQYVGMNAADRPDIDDVMEQLHLLQ